nr:TauD/TfdA family dioxygenase [Komagataeibacter sp. FNDCF1]
MTLTPPETTGRDPVRIVVDWRPFMTDHTIMAADVSDGDIDLRWSDGRQTRFNPFFLRDNCPCTLCTLPLTREQVFEIVDAPADLSVQSVSISASAAPSAVSDTVDGPTLDVVWSDGHRSAYPAGWLRAHATDDVSRAERRAMAGQPFIWGAEHADGLQTFDHDAIMHDDAALRAWLAALRTSGLTLVSGVPTQPDSLLGPAHRISHIRETNFGRVFDVKSKPTPDSAAYTSVNLPPHTDLPTRELQPGFQFLHCLVNDATGGESIFVDGFAIAQALRHEHPEHFATLTQTRMTFWNRDAHTDYRWSAPPVALDAMGEVSEIRFANFLRGPIDAPTARMPAIYAALRQFQAMTREPRFRIERRLSPGDMWVFDNRRVMHARREFDPQSGPRHLQGVYVDRDEVNSKYRILSRQGA